MRIALVGFGRWGRNHARVLAEAGRLAAVVDADPAQRDACRQMYPGLQVTADLEQLHWRGIAGVIIASPIEHHVSQARIVLERGKHCLVEKPLARDAEDVDQLARLAESSGCVLMTGHILDFHPGARELVRLCRSGRLGELRTWHSSRSRLVPPRRYVSVMEELLWHDLSVLLRVTERMPDQVQAIGELQKDGMLVLQFGNLVATLRGSQIQPLRESTILVAGTEGAIRLDDEQPLDRKLHYQSRGTGLEAIVLPSLEPLAAEIEHFVSAARGDAAPLSGAPQAEDILMILERARQSCLV